MMQGTTTLPQAVLSQVQAVFQRDPAADCVALVWPDAPLESPMDTVVEGTPVKAVYCVSELALREALVTHEQQRKQNDAGALSRLVLLSKFDAVTLAQDVLARLWKQEPQRISPWKTLPQLIKVRAIDPRLTRKHGRWIAEALLSGLDRYKDRISFGDVLDQDTAWRAIAMAHLDYNEPTLDVQSILLWSTKTDIAARMQVLAKDVRDNLADWLTPGLRDTQEVVATLLLNGQGNDLLPIGLACSVLFSADLERQQVVEASQLHLSRGVFRERYLAGKKLTHEALQALGYGALGLVQKWIGREPFKTYAGHLSKAEQILASLDMQAGAQTSSLLPCGFQARLQILALALKGALSGADTATVETALVAVQSHHLAELSGYQQTAARAEMAVRLLRWLKRSVPEPDSASQLMLAYLDDGGFCDWARAEIWAGDAHDALSAVYQDLSERVRDQRERHNQAFGRNLFSIARGDTLPDRLLPVERALDELVAPLAEQQRVLLLVLDGMSLAIYRQLTEDLVRHNWLELQPLQREGDACLVAALPTITKVSRCSLLSGMLCEGGASEEKKAFASHAQLKKIASTKFPPQVFHKPDLSQSGAGSLHSQARAVIAGTEHRILAVVINAIDDQLASSSQVHVAWSFETIALLRQVMEAAREAGRVVLVTSDHGHVLDQDSDFLASADENGERYQPALDGHKPSAREVLVSGDRVVTANKQVVLPWSERVRYTRSKSGGYHGGGSLQEVVIPLSVFMHATTGQAPEGWREVPRSMPDWWYATATGESAQIGEQTVDLPLTKKPGKKPQRVKPVDEVAVRTDDMFGFSAPEVTQEAIPADKSVDWIDQLLDSPVYQLVRDRAGRTAISPEALRDFIGLLERHQWQVMEAIVCRELVIPKIRIRGFLAGVQKLLNVDGYPILSVDRESQTIRLNVVDLKKQFEIE